MQLSSVVLPEPERPTRATSWPAGDREADVADRVHLARGRAVGSRDSASFDSESLGFRVRHFSSAFASSSVRTFFEPSAQMPMWSCLELEPHAIAQAEARCDSRSGSCSRPTRSSTAYSSRNHLGAPCSSIDVRRTTSDAVRPSRIATVRCTWRRTPRSRGSRSRRWRRDPRWPSEAPRTRRHPTRSRARRWARRRTAPRGLLARATAMATRCCSPPESSPGRRCALSIRCRGPRAALACGCSRSFAFVPAKAIGSETFSAALR